MLGRLTSLVSRTRAAFALPIKLKVLLLPPLLPAACCWTWAECGVEAETEVCTSEDGTSEDRLGVAGLVAAVAVDDSTVADMDSMRLWACSLVVHMSLFHEMSVKASSKTAQQESRYHREKIANNTS